MGENANEKKSLLAELIKLAKSDQDLRDVEFNFLLSMAAQLGVTKEDFKQLFEEYIAFMPPKMEAERIVQFHRLVLLMNVDQETGADELNYVREAGIRMGLNPMATNEILRIMNDYPNKVVPTERLIEIFKLYHN